MGLVQARQRPTALHAVPVATALAAVLLASALVTVHLASILLSQLQLGRRRPTALHVTLDTTLVQTETNALGAD